LRKFNGYEREEFKAKRQMMSKALRKVCENSLKLVLPVLQKDLENSKKRVHKWSKNGLSWRVNQVEEPSMVIVIGRNLNFIKDSSKDFLAELAKTNPDIVKKQALPTYGSFRTDFFWIFLNLISEVYYRYERLDVEQSKIDEIIDDFIAFLDKKKVTFRFLAILVNFSFEFNELKLTEGIRIRRLTANEVSTMPAAHRRGVHEFAVEGYFEEEYKPYPCPAKGSFRESAQAQFLKNLVIALNTFKEGCVGIENIEIMAKSFFPDDRMSLGMGEMFIPSRNYLIRKEEVDSLLEHVVAFQKPLPKQLRIASSRLSDAQLRTNLEDKIIDAVIGIEAILLASQKEDTSGLSYRFSLNYSTFFDSPEAKLKAYKTAKKLYNLRSQLAHGSEVKEKDWEISSDCKNSLDASKKACDMLRNLIRKYLPEGANPSFNQDDYWIKRILGFR
jgi:hypothetical protein